VWISIEKAIPIRSGLWNSFNNMSDDEMKGIFYFLKSVKPAKTPPVEKHS
jgi:hypothetical protein